MRVNDYLCIIERRSHLPVQSVAKHRSGELKCCVEFLIYWLNLELAIRLRLTPDSAA
jgi:hypothetical protein